MRKYQLLIMLFVIYGCNKKHNTATSADKDLHIQVMKKKSEVEGKVYNVRIFPKKEILEANKSITKNMIYDADSCFYLVKKQAKVYPGSVECIANGVSDSFEYLIRFDQDNLSETETSVLFYQDKYINQKIYQLLLK